MVTEILRDGQTDGPTDGRTDGRTDERTDRHQATLYYRLLVQN